MHHHFPHRAHPSGVRVFILLLLMAMAVPPFQATPAHALMPPHIRATEPPPGGLLTGNIYVIHGYTLSWMGEKDIRILDETGAEMAFTMETESEVEGHGDWPGGKQERCTLRLTIQGLEPGRRYQVELLGETLPFTTAR